ncbi:MAG: fatty acid desaturase [Caldilinea sp. CFX5]|nr:fatty acid desaturase [Caldilinea sp. CFX5]
MNKHLQGSAAHYAGWQAIVAKYQQPNLRKSLWQVGNSFGGFLLGWTLMYFSLSVGYWLTLLLALPTAGFLVRIFIIQHDCGHGSFFKARQANDSTGMISGILTMVPYRYWRKSHAIHHAHHAELEERGIGDIWTMTVEEYQAASWWTRLVYRGFRNPFFLFLIAPTINFVILSRLTLGAPESWRHGEKASVWWTNLALAGLWAGMSAFVGVGNFLLVHAPIIIIASSIGTWLFYVQHQFERTYWEHTPEWDFTLAAMQGSSYLKLPRILQWFTGNIGFHHIHHLSPRIPNYNLEDCHKENPIFQRVTELNLLSGFKTMSLTLWDEERRRLVTFREAAQRYLALPTELALQPKPIRPTEAI